MPRVLSRNQLLFAADAFFSDFAAGTSPSIILSHFSATQDVTIQHAPGCCTHPYTYRVFGLNAVRSYFDLIEIHWARSDVQTHSACAYPDINQVIVTASVRWTWKLSGRSWREEITCTLDYDEKLKIVNMVVKTESGPGTCLMLAVDADLLKSGEIPTVRAFWTYSFVAHRGPQ